MKRRLLGVSAAVLGTVLISGAGLYSTATAAPLGLTSVTLPVFGAPLTFNITTGPGGAISDVTVLPASGAVVTKANPHKVAFEAASATDSARIVIKSGKGEQKVSVRASTLANVSGPGIWSGDVFGTGAATTVNFTVGAADGSPTLTPGAISLGTGVAGVFGTVELSSGDGDHEGHDNESSASARVSIKFTTTAGDQSRTLSIKVRVETEDEGTQAKLSISLGRIKGVAGMAVGPHTWTGLLCDNTAASIAYTVAADGTLTLGAISPDGSTTSTDGGKTTVTFATGEKVSIKVNSHDDQMKVSVKEKIRCDSPDPTVNGAAVSLPPDTGDGDHHDGGGDHGHGDNGGGHKSGD